MVGARTPLPNSDDLDYEGNELGPGPDDIVGYDNAGQRRITRG